MYPKLSSLRHVGRHPATDVAMVVFYNENDEALSLILYELKPSVHPLPDYIEKADLIELMIELLLFGSSTQI